MAKLHEKNKTIIPSAERTFNSSSRDTIALNSKRVANDIYRISDFINQVIVKSYNSLTSSREYPYDVLEEGISGNTIVTWTKELGNARGNHPIFWKTENEIDVGRPCTIKESFDWIYRNFSRQIQEIERASVDFSPLEDSIRCIAFKIEKLKNEVLTENYGLDCEGVAQRIYTYSLSTHVYNILAQLTEGMNPSDINPYNDPDPDYPQLSIPYDRISDRIEYAYQLKDIDYSVKAGNGQILVWQTNPPDPDNDGGAEGAWVPKYPNEVFTDTDTKIQYIDELKDVEIGSEELGNGYVLTWDETVVDNTDPNNTQAGAWVPRPLPDPTVDTRIEYLTELKDVNVLYPLNDPADANFILKFNPESEDTEAGVTGRWEAANLNDLIPEEVDLTTNIGQRIGGARRDSTLDDVYSVSEIIETWLTENNLTDPSEATPEQNLDLTKRSASRFRAGASLSYDGNLWHSKLAGNTSNLNEVEFIPEIHLKGSSYIEGLSSVEIERLVFGGYNAIPFVFVNNFDIKMKELLEPNYRGIIAYSSRGEIPLTSNESLNLISQNFDENSISSILNSIPTNNSNILKNEIATNTPSRPIGSMKVSEKYTDANGVERVYYKPEKILGVCRTDMDNYSFPTPGLPATPNFIEDAEGNLTGEINPLMNYIVQLKVARNVGIGVQHSGYSRIMVLGPYVHGDNLYICPAPILEAAGINYPYGICISDTFVSTPLKELFLGEKDTLLSSSYPEIYSQANFSIYDMIADALTVIDSELKDKILSHPVAFVTRDDSPFISLDINLNQPVEAVESHNIANIICRNLLGLNNTGLQTGSAIYAGVLNYFNNISSAERADYQENVLHAPGGSLATKYIYNAGSLHLPLCKIATGSFNHEGVKQTINNFDWATYINPSIIDGYLSIAGLNLGLVVGATGETGAPGAAGNDGQNGMITISGMPIEHPAKSDGTAEVIPSNYNLVPEGHNLTHLSFSRQSYPTLRNFDFSLQLRVVGLTQPIKVSVWIAPTPIGWVQGDDPTLYQSVNIISEYDGPNTMLSFDPDVFENNNTVIINNYQGKWDMDQYRSISLILEIRTTEENISGLNDICSGIYTNLTVNPN